MYTEATTRELPKIEAAINVDKATVFTALVTSLSFAKRPRFGLSVEKFDMLEFDSEIREKETSKAMIILDVAT